ncbi:MAG: hypothetical protein HC913_21315 [Microscillaceae bacterium]|nr:hypothetical protein [Microscillaceae bacterium]
MLLHLMFALGAIALFALLMSVGLLLKGKPLEGTCASKNAVLGLGGTCSVCGQAVGSCETETSPEQKETA